MNIIKNKKYFLGASLILVILSIIVVLVKGLTYSIEFTGGSLLEVTYPERPAVSELTQRIEALGIEAQVQALGENNFLIKAGSLTEEQHKALIDAATFVTSSNTAQLSPENSGETEQAVQIQSQGTVERFTSIGPSVGKELQSKAIWAIILVSLGIIFFIAYAFRKITEPVSSWKYGVVAVIALVHDLIIPVGIMTLLGTPIDTLYIVGLLSILGISVNDTIVVFDRIRENLEFNHLQKKDQKFDTTINDAIKDTMIRSVFTSLTLVVVLVVLYLAGPETTKNLSLVLLLGTIVGTYSSIFVASPLLTYLLPKKEV